LPNVLRDIEDVAGNDRHEFPLRFLGSFGVQSLEHMALEDEKLSCTNRSGIPFSANFEYLYISMKKPRFSERPRWNHIASPQAGKTGWDRAPSTQRRHYQTTCTPEGHLPITAYQ
jgi:hypothetical protein